MLYSVMVKTTLNLPSILACRKPAIETKTFFLVDTFSNGANAKSCVFDKK